MNTSALSITNSRFIDWFFYIFIANYIYVIPQFRPLPTSFLTLGTILGLFLLIWDFRRCISSYERKALLGISVLLFLVLYQYFVDFFFLKKPSENILFIAALFTIILFFGKVNLLRDELVLEKITKVYVVVLVISMFWYLACYFSSPFYKFSNNLYQKDSLGFSSREISGLSQHAHLFGYQLAPLCLILLARIITTNTKISKILLIITILSLFTIFLLGERSVLIAVLFGLLSLIIKNTYRKRLLKLLLGLCCLFTVIIAFGGHKNISERYEYNILGRLSGKETNLEFKDRIKLQVVSLKILFENPAGLITGNKDWKKEAYSKDYKLFSRWRRVIAPHNGYLTMSVEYGWFMLILIVIMTIIVFSIIRELMRLQNGNKAFSENTLPLCCAMIGCLVQAMGHNGSFSNLEPATIVCMLLLFAWYSRVMQIKHKYINTSEVRPQSNEINISNVTHFKDKS